MSRRDRIIRQALRERFTATLRGGESFEGLLVDADVETFRFVNAFAVDAKNNRAPVDGELFLARTEVLYLQRLGGVA